ncbi:NACHT domain-containing protein [Actinophytocola sp.]|uniref:NACHT domain-containing protein n=1 Tax=Actinophytocola sp. TaxID=1872138 RepID=UPI002D760FA9|nr:NACHT domain-containing protein [Actinophytocola sp.]HYQ68945.1 NACHT domain-containing protein [Actinophytocola sp.]
MDTILSWFLGGATAAMSGTVLYVWRRRVAQFANWVDRKLEQGLSRFPVRYRRYLVRESQYIDLKGLSTLGSTHPELDDVFVEVSLEHRAPHEIAVGVLPDTRSDANGRYRLDDLLDQPQPRVLAMLGAHGSGKTTLVRHTVREICLSRRDRRRTIPILVYLRDHVDDIVENPKIELPALVRRQLGRLGRAEPAGWFEQRLENGDCVVLLDGLDEVASQDVVADWVERLTRHYPKNDFIITSRPQGYRATPIDGATVLQVPGFSDAQVAEFVRGWYGVVEREVPEERPGDLEKRVQRSTSDLLRRLEDTPELGDLTVNPLLLTMIANIHRYRPKLPGTRVELYSEICRAVLWGRQKAKGLLTELNGEHKEGLVRELAFTMMRDRKRDLRGDDLLKHLRGSLQHISTSLTPETLLSDLGSSGILVERKRGWFSFAHVAFQEYLAAMHMCDSGQVGMLAAAVDDVWWRETTLMYAARASADEVVTAWLVSGKVTALALAFDVADSGSDEGDIAPELRHALDELLSRSAADSERQRLRDGVLVTRSLRRSTVRTRTGARVCVVPVGQEIYRLFAGEQRVPAPDGPAADPVTGVWARDAVEFVAWVNEVTGGVPGYRLATAAELDELKRRPLVGNNGFSVWTNPDADGPRLWTPDPAWQPHRVDAETLLSHIHADFTRTIPTLVHLALIEARRSGPDDWFDSEATRLARALIREHLVNETDDDTPGRHPSLSIIRQDDVIRGVVHGRSSLDLIEELDTALQRDGDLGHVTNLARKLVRQQARARELDLTVDIPGSPALDMVAHALQPLLRLVTESDSQLTRTNSGSLADKFIHTSWAEEAARIVALDELEATIRQTAAETRTRSAMHISKIAGKLTQVALPIVARATPVTTSLATAIRTTALSLAADAGCAGADRLSDRYREIAAGITLMERRGDGRSRPTETLILAIS